MVCNLAYGASINDQIAVWRWKRLLSIPKKPQLIEVTKATSCKNLAALINFKLASNKAWAFRNVGSHDPSIREKMLRRLALIMRRTPQIAFEKWKNNSVG